MPCEHFPSPLLISFPFFIDGADFLIFFLNAPYLVPSLSPSEAGERVLAGQSQSKLWTKQFATSPAKFCFHCIPLHPLSEHPPQSVSTSYHSPHSPFNHFFPEGIWTTRTKTVVKVLSISNPWGYLEACNEDDTTLSQNDEYLWNYRCQQISGADSACMCGGCGGGNRYAQTAAFSASS